MHHARISLIAVLLLLAACAVEPAASQPASVAPSTALPSEAAPTAAPELVPPEGRVWFGMNLDWGSETINGVTDRLGATPAVWVQFVRFPLTDGDRGNLAGFFEQVGAAGARGLVTLEPHDGLDAVTPEAAAELASALDAAWTDHGVATFVRFAHEMNGSWYAWGQQPDAYVEAFRLVADAVGPPEADGDHRDRRALRPGRHGPG